MRRLAQVRTTCLVVALCGIGARTAVALFADIPFPDATHYRSIAASIARGEGYADVTGPTAYWVPMYALVLGVFRRLGGEWGMRVLELVLSVSTMVLAGAFARRAYGRTTALVAAAIVGVLPSFVLLAGTHISENLGIPALLGALVLALAASRGRWLGDVLVGAASGLAILTREASAAVLPAAALVVWTAKRRVASAVIVVLVAVFVMTPWVFRNARTIGVPTLSTSSGDNLCVGLGDGATGGWRRAFDDGGRPATATREAERHRAGLACAGSAIRANALRIVALVPGKLTRLFAYDDWLTDDIEPGALRRALAVAANAVYWAVLLLAILGARRGRMRPLARTAFGGVLVTTIAIVLVTFGNGRFHAPLLALIAAPAARGVLSLRHLRAAIFARTAA